MDASIIPAPADVAAAPSSALRTENGLAWLVLTANPNGQKVQPKDWVKLHYTGWTTDGNMFDSSIPTGKPAIFPIDNLITGMNQALQLAHKGEKIRVWIPEELAYKGIPGAPQGTLVFEFDIIDIVNQEKPVMQPTADAVSLHDGLAYHIDERGTGTADIDETSIVALEFTGWSVESGERFHSSIEVGEPLVGPVKNFFPGFSEVLVHAHQGDKLTIWVPQAFGVDPAGKTIQGSQVFTVEVLHVREAPKPIPAPADVAAPPADAIKTASGLATKVLEPGTGSRHPGGASRVRVHYTGWTTDGKMFDSSVVRGQAIEFNLNQVIAGWTEGVQLMVEGEKRRLWIPQDLAYKGQPGAPAGMLVFDVELIAIV